MKAAPFAYHRPESVKEAADMLAEFGDDAKVLAGGQSLVPMLAMRLTHFDNLIDISRVDELCGIDLDHGAVRVGATTSHALVGMDDEVADSVPLLTMATPHIGHFQIRTRGTLGGAIAHADPAAEYAAVALALDADMEAHSSRGPRAIPAAEFFTGLWETSLASDEILTAVRFPVWDGRSGFAVHEFARRHGDFAIAGAVAAVEGWVCSVWVRRHCAAPLPRTLLSAGRWATSTGTPRSSSPGRPWRQSRTFPPICRGRRHTGPGSVRRCWRGRSPKPSQRRARKSDDARDSSRDHRERQAGSPHRGTEVDAGGLPA